MCEEIETSAASHVMLHDASFDWPVSCISQPIMQKVDSSVDKASPSTEILSNFSFYAGTKVLSPFPNAFSTLQQKSLQRPQ